MNTQAAIRVSHIQKAYGRAIAVADVSFDVRQGEIFGLIGPNGAGKTTTMECVEGLRSPDRGAISVLGLNPVRDASPAAAHRRAAAGSAAAEADQGLGGRRSLGVALRQAGRRQPPARAARHREKRDAWFMTLSGGQKQRLFIALALIHDPELVFLDELTTGLDPQARRAIWDLVRGIRDRGKTVFLTTHLMEEAERLCDRVAIIDHGRIVDVGTPARAGSPALPRTHGHRSTTADAAAEEHFARDAAAWTTSCGPAERITVRGRGDLVTT